MVAFFQGQNGEDSESLGSALQTKQLVLPSVVVTEILSAPRLAPEFEELILGLPRLEFLPDTWVRAAYLRRRLIERKLRAYVADALIAQLCIDHQVALISRDKDFAQIAKLSDLILAAPQKRK